MISTRFSTVFGNAQSPFIVVYKPPGLVVQGKNQGELSVERLLMRARPKARQIYFPHQLDKDAQGLLVVAFSQRVCAALNKSIAERQWIKKYRIMVDLPRCIDMSATASNISTSPASLSSNHRSCWLQSPLLDAEQALFHSQSAEGAAGVRIGSLGAQGPPIVMKSSGTLDTLLVPRTPQLLTARARADQSTTGQCPPQGCSHCRSDLKVSADSAVPSLHALLQSEHVIAKSGSLSNSISPAVWQRLCKERSSSSDDSSDSESRSKRCISHYKLTHLLPEHHHALFEVSTETGRKHQLRVQFADAGLPVVGDPFYNPYQLQRILHGCAVDGWDFANLSLKQWLNPQVGLGLQAFHLEFPNPVAGLHLNSIQPSDPGAKVLYECSNNTVRVSVPLPDEWASLNPRSVDAML